MGRGFPILKVLCGVTVAVTLRHISLDVADRCCATCRIIMFQALPSSCWIRWVLLVAAADSQEDAESILGLMQKCEADVVARLPLIRTEV